MLLGLQRTVQYDEHVTFRIFFFPWEVLVPARLMLLFTAANHFSILPQELWTFVKDSSNVFMDVYTLYTTFINT